MYFYDEALISDVFLKWNSCNVKLRMRFYSWIVRLIWIGRKKYANEVINILPSGLPMRCFTQYGSINHFSSNIPPFLFELSDLPILH